MVQEVCHWPLNRLPWFEPDAVQIRNVADKVAPGQVFARYV